MSCDVANCSWGHVLWVPPCRSPLSWGWGGRALRRCLLAGHQVVGLRWGLWGSWGGSGGSAAGCLMDTRCCGYSCGLAPAAVSFLVQGVGCGWRRGCLLPTALPLHLCICLQAPMSSPAIWVACGHPLFSGSICVDGIDGTFCQAIRKNLTCSKIQMHRLA